MICYCTCNANNTQTEEWNLLIFCMYVRVLRLACDGWMKRMLVTAGTLFLRSFPIFVYK